MQRKRKRAAMIVAIILAALMLIPVVIGGLSVLFPEARAAVTQKDIKDLKENLSALKENKKKVQGQIRNLKDRQADVAQRKMLYDEQIALYEEEMDLTVELIAQLNLAIAESQQELDEKTVQEAEMSALFVRRVQAMARMGDISYLSILLGAESLTDMLTRWNAMREVMARDKKLAEELVGARLEIEETIARLDGDKQEQYERRLELAGSQTELAELSDECDAMMAKYLDEMAALQADEKKLAEAEAEADKELKAMETEWAKIQEELKKRNNKYVGGEYQWPVPGYTTISSPFGNRFHPIYKVWKMHTGIDIPAPKGTKICAANAGEVIIKTYSSGYGNYVAVDHGGGQVSLYAHMSSFANVKVGSMVKTGDVVGYVGSTGVSTGNHLHFEIRKNNVPVDPEPLLRGK
ncbi:MAG: peptidoglycan DD-metalloendopeptidase family protein [Oscillospiraceae bacterium]|jgi:murein DD-endopeptidase MepM/ murein hydrolase activator NlpD|nr:peptidoglycan DD-metalloendopeptidase family protein [Oscillospiraceae bacterium]